MKVPYDSTVDTLIRGLMEDVRHYGHIDAYEVYAAYNDEKPMFSVIHSSLHNISVGSIKTQIIRHNPSGYTYMLQSSDDEPANSEFIGQCRTNIHYITLSLSEV